MPSANLRRAIGIEDDDDDNEALQDAEDQGTPELRRSMRIKSPTAATRRKRSSVSDPQMVRGDLLRRELERDCEKTYGQLELLSDALSLLLVCGEMEEEVIE